LPLRAYYDGSGKSHGPTSHLTLAGIAACDSVWPEFESAWKAVLAKHPGITQLHMTDAMAVPKRGEFAEWSQKQVDALIIDFLNAVAPFRSRHIMAISCTVDLDDHMRAKRAIPNLRSPESMCVDFCTGRIAIPTDDKNKPKCVMFFFDRGEKFLHRINGLWERHKKQRHG